MKHFKKILLICLITTINPISGSSPAELSRAMNIDEQIHRHLAPTLDQIKTIADIEETAEILANAFIAQQPQNALPPKPKETVKNSIRKFYLDGNNQFFIQLAKKNAEDISPLIQDETQINAATQRFKQALQIPQNRLYNPIIKAFQDHLIQLFQEKKHHREFQRNQQISREVRRLEEKKAKAQNDKEVQKDLIRKKQLDDANQAAKASAQALKDVPKNLHELAKAIEHFKSQITLPNEVDHQIIINTFRDTLKERMLIQQISLIISTQPTILTPSDEQDLINRLPLIREHYPDLESQIWAKFFKSYYNTQLGRLKNVENYKALSEEEFRPIKDRVTQDAYTFNLPPETIEPMQLYIKQFLKNFIEKERLLQVEKENLLQVEKERLLQAKKENLLQAEKENKFQAVKQKISSIRQDSNIDQTLLYQSLQTLFSESIKKGITDAGFVAATTVPKELTLEDLHTINNAINIFRLQCQKAKNNTPANYWEKQAQAKS